MVTKERVKAIREGNPKALAINIAREVGVSRERVRQILVRLDLPTSFPREPTNWCCFCVKPIREGRLYCNQKCNERAHRAQVVCRACGAGFSLRLSAYHARSRRSKVDGLWCSRACWNNNHRHQDLCKNSSLSFMASSADVLADAPPGTTSNSEF